MFRPGSSIVVFIGSSIATGQCEPQWLPAPPGQGVTGAVNALTIYAGDLIAAGAVTGAGGQPVGRIARWNGVAWAPLGAGVSGGDVHALTVYAGDLIAGGAFTSAGGAPADRIARWDGANWWPLGTGTNAQVRCLTTFENDLIVGGFFTTAGQVNPTGIARWNGTKWGMLGTNIIWGVWAVGAHDGVLYASSADPCCGELIPYVFRWNGQVWENLPGLHTGIGAAITAFTSHNGSLVAGGMNAAVQRWTGSGWSKLGDGGTWSGMSFAEHRGRLVVGADPFFTPTVVFWDGVAWSTPPSGPNHAVYAVARHADTLYAGGVFTTAGGAPSPGWARYGCACYSDCDASGGLSVADFGCFQTQFVLGHPYADCNGDDALTVADFGCFQTKFVAGCP